ncbi:hypothetical protein LCGC14_2217720, partial [marine sediment metagenome]
ALAGVGVGNLSINLWMNSSDNTTNQYALIIGNDLVGPSDQWIIVTMTASGEIQAQAHSTGNDITLTGSADVQENEWNMVTVIRKDVSNWSLYINSILVVSDIEPVLTLGTAFNNANMTIGNSNHPTDFGLQWNGTIDEIGIFLNRTLSQSEINDFYNGGAGKKPTIQSFINETWQRTITDDIIWNVQGCDTDGDCGFAVANRTLFLDAGPPQITIIHPSGNEGSNIIGGSQDLNWSIIELNPDECWYNYNGTNVSVTCSDNNTTFILELNNLNLTFYANDTLGNENSTFTSWFYNILAEGETFNDFVFETATEDFSLNISILPSTLNIEALLNYNGTRFTTTNTCVSNLCIVETAIDIPLNPGSVTSENRTFFWEITGFNATDSFTINTTTQVQNVTSIFLEFCNVTFTVETLNFTAFDEQTLLPVDPFRFSADFEFWLGTGSVFKNNSFENSSASSVQLCIQPGTEEYEINAVVEYDEGSGTSYTIRNYYFQNDFIDNVSEDIGLGLLFSNQSTSFILKVQDADILPLPNALVFTQRFYAGLGEFRTVQVAKTDDNGKSVGFFEVETADYRFIIKRDGEVLLVTPTQNRSQKVVGEETPFTLTFTIGDDRGASWE